MQKTMKNPMQMEMLRRKDVSTVTLYGVSSVDHFTTSLVMVCIGRGTVRLMGSGLCIRTFEGHILEVRGNISEMGFLGHGDI